MKSPGLAVVHVSLPFQRVSMSSARRAVRAATNAIFRAEKGFTPRALPTFLKSTVFRTLLDTRRCFFFRTPEFWILNICPLPLSVAAVLHLEHDQEKWLPVFRYAIKCTQIA